MRKKINCFLGWNKKKGWRANVQRQRDVLNMMMIKRGG